MVCVVRLETEWTSNLNARKCSEPNGKKTLINNRDGRKKFT